MKVILAGLRRIVRPLESRKVRVALATVIAAYLADYGLEAGEEIVLTILGVGIALILGIAHEDNGLAIGASKLVETDDRTAPEPPIKLPWNSAQQAKGTFKDDGD